MGNSNILICRMTQKYSTEKTENYLCMLTLNYKLLFVCIEFLPIKQFELLSLKFYLSLQPFIITPETSISHF